jgi:hypothetical protein
MKENKHWNDVLLFVDEIPFLFQCPVLGNGPVNTHSDS